MDSVLHSLRVYFLGYFQFDQMLKWKKAKFFKITQTETKAVFTYIV